jgi:hypothetical protein
VPQVGTQAEAVQRVLPLALVQGAAHAPQWFVLVANVVSQPLLGLPSQLPKPLVQVFT